MTNLHQGSTEWLAERKGRITASKLPKIMGKCPHQTPLQLWNEELGFGVTPSYTKHLDEGHEAEIGARKYFAAKIGVIVKPGVRFTDEIGCSMASLDGINDEGTIIVEIKNNNKDYHEMAKLGKVPENHLIQMQAQMFACDLQQCHYLSYRKGDEVIVVVARDDEFIAKMIEAGREFKSYIDDLIPPPLQDRDYIDISDNVEVLDLVQRYKYYSSMEKEYGLKKDQLKQEICTASGDRNVKGQGFKLSKYSTKGKIDYASIPQLQSLVDQGFIDLDKHRKAPTTCYRITVE